MLAQVVAFYQQTLKDTPDALDYLRRRGISNGQAIDHFRIGYADRSLGKLLPSKDSKAGREIRSRLEALGLFRGSGHEHFSGCVVFPIMAGDGTRRIVDIYGQKMLGERLRKGTPLHMHLGDVRHGVWNVEAFGATEEIILCPSLFDALTFWNHGYRNVTCMFGPDALTDDHFAAFQEFNIKRILTPCEAVTPKLLDAGIDCFLLKFPPGMDVNAYARQVNDPAAGVGAGCSARPSGSARAASGDAAPCPLALEEPAGAARQPSEVVDAEDEDADEELLDDCRGRPGGSRPLDDADEAEEPAAAPAPETGNADRSHRLARAAGPRRTWTPRSRTMKS